MAKYIGLLSSDARGKIGGTVMSRSTAGTTLKGHAVPKKPTTLLQQQSQQGMANAITAWRGLTTIQQTSWVTYAAGVVYTDSLGVGYSPSGLQLYTQAFINARRVGAVPPATIPGLTFLPPPIFTVGLSYSGGALNITADTGTATYPSIYFASLSPPIASSVNYIRSARYRFLRYLIDGNPYSVATAYVRAFGSLPAPGQRVAVKVMPIEPTAFISGATTILAVTVVP